MAIQGYTWQYIAMHGNARRYMVIDGSTGVYMAIQGYTWQYMAVHGNTLEFMEIHSDTWQYIAIHGNAWLYTGILYNYPPKRRLFTDPEGDSCFSIYHITWIKKMPLH